MKIDWKDERLRGIKECGPEFAHETANSILVKDISQYDPMPTRSDCEERKNEKALRLFRKKLAYDPIADGVDFFANH